MNVAITGGTGTLGRALIAQFLKDGAERVVSISRDEVKAGELRSLHTDPRLNVFLGDVRDRERLKLAFHGCDVVIHAAALKRVPVGEAYDSLEMIKTNIQGTINVVMAAMEAKVGKVIIVSSDKAVHATNLYGATKFTAECFAVGANSYTYPHGTRISCVRYGNVWASRGSVIEIWHRHLSTGPVLPLTDKRMTRFVIMQWEAVALIKEALERMQGGEIFIPQLNAMKLEDLGYAMGAAHFHIVGLRPGGEKLHERLISDEEASRIRRYMDTNTLVVTPSHRSWSSQPYGGIVAFVEDYSSDRVAQLSVEELKLRLCIPS